MADAPTDILMYVCRSASGSQVAAECQAQLTSSDSLTRDFSAGCFFEIQDMSLGLTLMGNEGQGRTSIDHTWWSERSAGWHRRSAAGTSGAPPFKVEPDPLTFTRLIDKASPVLLQLCLELTTFPKVVLVKRHSVGGSAPLGFLRLEFTDATLNSIDWSDDDAVKEKCSLSYQGLAMTLVPRKPSGLPLPEKSASWTNKAHRTG